MFSIQNHFQDKSVQNQYKIGYSEFIYRSMQVVFDIYECTLSNDIFPTCIQKRQSMESLHKFA